MQPEPLEESTEPPRVVACPATLDDGPSICQVPKVAQPAVRVEPEEPLAEQFMLAFAYPLVVVVRP